MLHFLLQRFNNPFFPCHVFFILVKLSLIIIINTLFILQKMDQLSFKETAGINLCAVIKYLKSKKKKQ